MTEGPVDLVGYPVQSDGLIQQIVVRCPLYVDRQMIPGVALRLARNTGGRPLLVLVVVDVPFVPARNTTFVAKDETLVVKELVDVKLQSLRKSQIISIKVNVVGEVMQSGDQRMLRVGHALRGGRANQEVVPQCVREGNTASDVEFSALPA